MSIKEKLKMKDTLISFEIFPPKKNDPVDIIYSTIDELTDLGPDFISVTYGAGGSTKDTTIDIAGYIQNKYNLCALAHLTCITSTKEEIGETLEKLRFNNIRNILALRGDYPQNGSSEVLEKRDYKYACDLIYDIKSHYDFCIGAACYPEKHPECDSIGNDLRYLKEKADAGVDFLITQLFFDNETLFNYKDNMDRLNINVPIVAGILPVLNKNQVKKIISLTNCRLPKKFQRILEKYEHNPEALKEAGIAYAIEQVIDLIAWGIDGIHVYTMNRPNTTRKILSSLPNIRESINLREGSG